MSAPVSHDFSINTTPYIVAIAVGSALVGLITYVAIQSIVSSHGAISVGEAITAGMASMSTTGFFIAGAVASGSIIAISMLSQLGARILFTHTNLFK